MILGGFSFGPGPLDGRSGHNFNAEFPLGAGFANAQEAFQRMHPAFACPHWKQAQSQIIDLIEIDSVWQLPPEPKCP